MLEKLKEYKELIAILVFFLGGFAWIQGQYPTKTDLKSQVTVLECLLQKYMALTQLQIHGQQLQQEIQERRKQIQMMEGMQLSPAMQSDLEEKRKDLGGTQGDLKTNLAEINKINDELRRNVCGRVTP